LAVLAAASGCDGARVRGRQRAIVGAPRATSPRDGAADRAMRPSCQGIDSRPDGVASPGQTRFAVIGDYGQQGPDEERVARLVHEWRPDFIITAGDNNYPLGAAETIDGNIGQYYHDFISPYLGQFGCGARQNRFFPSLGNHDWYTPGARPYLDYFTLPGNERYYDVVFGDVHLFAIDSDPSEPDGVAPNSVQANWLRQTAAASRATWQIAYMHHPPFSSGPHLSTDYMRWPYKAFGIDVVFAGHDHDYERLEVDGLPYIVNGLGGAPLYAVGELLPGSQNHFADTFGAVLVEATPTTLSAKFIAVDGRTIDQLVLTAAR
jgi:tartrate-resistant acid phosphatase type 5